MKKLTLVVIMILNLLMIGGCMQDKNETTKTQARQNMKNYLESTYHKKFEVEKVKTAGSWGMGYYYSAIAYPQENKDLKFSIRCSKAKKTDYYESYLSTKWTVQGKQEIEKKVKELYGEDVYVIFDFPYNNVKLKDLNFNEVLKKCQGNAVLDIRILVFTDKLIDKQEEAKKIFEIYKEYILSNNIKMYDLNITHAKKEKKIEFESSKDIHATMNKLFEESKIPTRVHLDNFRSKVTNVEDIIKYFKY